MRVCAVQMDIAWEDKETNMSACRRMVQQAGECDLILFPEMTLTGFSMNAGLAEPPDGKTYEFFMGLSKEFGAAIVFGYPVSVGCRIYNRLCAVDSGRQAAFYDKMHPFSYGGECEVFSSGSEVCEADIRGIKTGFTICYDLRFPELYQKLSQNCPLIVCSASWPEKRREHWITLLKARAIETQSYIVGCNRVGSGGGLSYSGDSMIISPFGDIIAQAAYGKEQLIYADISAEVAETARSEFPVKADRRNDIYKKFY